jgi:hypothetical protein
VGGAGFKEMEKENSVEKPRKILKFPASPSKNKTFIENNKN